MIGQQKRIEEVLRRFDFRVVKDVMSACRLVWKDEKGDEYIPTQKEIELRARELVINAARTKTHYVKVSYEQLVCRKTQTALELSFVIESASA